MEQTQALIFQVHPHTIFPPHPALSKGGYTWEQKVAGIREYDRRSVANMFAIVYTLFVAVERHERIQLRNSRIVLCY